MKTEEIIVIIENRIIPAEQKAELIKQIKFNHTKDKILTILKFLDIGADIISLFID